MPKQSSDDPTFLRRALSTGDPELTERVRDRVRRIVAHRGYGIPRQDQDDLVQATVVQVWEAASRPDFDASGFWSFVQVVASRRCIDWRRLQKPQAPVEALESHRQREEDALAGLLQEERTHLAQRALSRLSDSCRELITLYARDGLTYRDLSRRLGRSEPALRVQMHRCIARAAVELEKLLDENAPPRARNSSAIGRP